MWKSILYPVEEYHESRNEIPSMKTSMKTEGNLGLVYRGDLYQMTVRDGQ